MRDTRISGIDRWKRWACEPTEVLVRTRRILIVWCNSPMLYGVRQAAPSFNLRDSHKQDCYPASMACVICQQQSGLEHVFREMMFGTRDTFTYFECSECGCIQMAEVPANLAAYYPSGYYSLKNGSTFSKRLTYAMHFNAARLLPALRQRGGAAFRSIMRLMPAPQARILDVGCGAGDLVAGLRFAGLDANGIDPFINAEGPHVKRMGLPEAQPGWDVIMFHHSLEHMPDQLGTLRSIREKLNPTGTAIIRMPVVNWAWRHFGSDWVQLDAPRHLAIHTVSSIQRACAIAGLKVVRTVYDSDSFQFAGSEMYRRNIPLSEGPISRHFSKAQWKSFKEEAANLNRKQLGDQAAFYLRPDNG